MKKVKDTRCAVCGEFIPLDERVAWNRCLDCRVVYYRNYHQHHHRTPMKFHYTTLIAKNGEGLVEGAESQSIFINGGFFHSRCQRALVFRGVNAREEVEFYCSRCLESVYLPTVAFSIVKGGVS